MVGRSGVSPGLRQLRLLTRYFRRDSGWGLAWVGFHGLWAWVEGPFQRSAIAALPVFWWANGQRGTKAGWFYGFDPGHLAARSLIRWLG